MIDDMDIGRRLRELREAKGLSQRDMEKRTGLLRTYISRLEGGHTLPSHTTLDKFAKALDIDPDLLSTQAHSRQQRALGHAGRRSRVNPDGGKREWQHLLLRNLVTEGYSTDEAKVLVELAGS